MKFIEVFQFLLFSIVIHTACHSQCGFVMDDDARLEIHYSNNQVQSIDMNGACDIAHLTWAWDVESIEIYGMLHVTIPDENGAIKVYVGNKFNQVMGEYEPTVEYEVDPGTHNSALALNITRIGSNAILYEDANYKGERIHLNGGMSSTSFIYKSWKLAPECSLGDGSKLFFQSKASFNGIKSTANIVKLQKKSINRNIKKKPFGR